MDISLDLPSFDHIPFPIIPIDVPVTQVFADEEEDFAGWTSNEKTSDTMKVDDDAMDVDILEIDRQIGSRLLDAEVFGGAPCESPIGPIEELLRVVEFDKEDQRLFLSPFFDDDSHMTTDDEDNSSLPFEERYKATLKKLALTMKKSQETRKSLTMKTAKTEAYDRLTNIEKILSSVAKSANQVQTIVTAGQA
jgi:hypothetical protein